MSARGAARKPAAKSKAVANADKAATEAVRRRLRVNAAPYGEGFARFSNAIARWTGQPLTFALCCVLIVVWGGTGPLFGYSDTWQLIINTGTTIVTFLMVFLIQNTQNRDGAAVQAKLDELIRAVQGARNQFVGIERLTEEELEQIRQRIEAEQARRKRKNR